ncbi:RNA methyltransferase [Gemella sp. GH3]|uniref:TrmH family RNA methyltransferase n=1 Tax=unclassified Gemella TaxID=2624949 RepID=UPI0015D014DF|nr:MULTISPECIES: RNA methyltransferase [unclassified Gemella]MBF0713224.1 RNA methyltransferase [Gemella sp. GH3.1]NYS50176.1 RNA methyltransferase [Gemella sp. GH3]
MKITSSSNKKIKELIKLKDIKEIRKKKKYIVDGLHLVEEAVKNDVALEIFVSENFSKDLNFVKDNIEINIIDEKLTDLISSTVNNQGIFAICKIVDKELLINNYSNIIILDSIQDPGNLGTIIRTADAFGYDCVILGKGTTNMYSQKVIRSMQGSNFHIDCFDSINIIEFMDKLEGFEIYATSLEGSCYLEEINEKPKKSAIIFGNEANGVSKEILAKVNNPIKVNMPGLAESLNVAVTSGIIMHYIKNVLE